MDFDMPIPMEYQHASEDFMRFLADARDEAGLGTMNQSFTMVDGVLRTFRRRLSTEGIAPGAGLEVLRAALNDVRRAPRRAAA
ncbi:MAG: hypothetical protein B7Y01_00110 [Xanthobacter sp. 17-67-6]|nr:MAG: hypothetical protein B7Y01_00110 [Xanthobacter sp. 17-67-6]